MRSGSGEYVNDGCRQSEEDGVRDPPLKLCWEATHMVSPLIGQASKSKEIFAIEGLVIAEPVSHANPTFVFV